MKWTKLALTTMTLATFSALFFAACDDPPSPESEYESEPMMRSMHVNAPFQLDRDAEDPGLHDSDPANNPPPDDWETIAKGGHSAVETTGIVKDIAGSTIFIGGNSKDPNLVADWRHTEGSVPDKNELTNAYAAAYNNADGEFILYFGADRYSTSGSAFFGLWFFQDSIEKLDDGSFSGEHQDGDLLVLVNFEQGGVNPVIQIFKWKSGAANNLELVTTEGECDSSNANQMACAITNNATVPSYWNYDPKTGPNNTFAPGAFVEGGINLTEVYDEADLPCFASFMAETRASTSVTATLKDFVLHEFQDCTAGMDLQAACKATTVRATADGVHVVVNYSASVCNTSTGPGGLGLTDVVLKGMDGETLFAGDLATCKSFASESFEPTTISVGGPEASTARFTGKVTAEATGFDGEEIKMEVPLNCPLCPACG